MVERFDIGDNSAYFSIGRTDTLSDIIQKIDPFLAFKGWTKISFETTGVDNTISRHIYSALNLDGSTKRLALFFIGNSLSGRLRLGVGVTNESGEEIGFTKEKALYPDSGDNAAKLQELRPILRYVPPENTVIVVEYYRLYIFANPRWCLFITTDVNGDSVSTASAVAYPDFSNYSMDSIGFHFADEYGIDTWIYDDPMPAKYALYWRNEALNQAGGIWNLTRHGAIGCVELIGDINGSCVIDTANLAYSPSDYSIVGFHAKSILGGKYRDRVDHPVETFNGVSKLGVLPSDLQDYSLAPLTKYPWNNKTIVGDIDIVSKTFGFLGIAAGLKLTEASTNTKLEGSVNLKSDYLYNLSKSGSTTKFFKIPGRFKYYGSYGRRNWQFNPNKIMIRNYYWQGSSANPGNPPYLRVIGGDSYSNGYWVIDYTPFELFNNSSFLIPA